MHIVSFWPRKKKKINKKLIKFFEKDSKSLLKIKNEKLISQIRIVFLGLGAVGKSALIIRFIQDTFVESYEPTITNVYKKQINLDGKNHMIEVLDTAGMEDDESLKASFIRNRDCFFLVYSLTDRTSFEEIREIYNDVIRFKTQNESEKIPIVLIGNKKDLEDQRQISTKEGQELAREINAIFVETSALTGENVEDAIFQGVKEHLKTLPPDPIEEKRKWRCVLI